MRGPDSDPGRSSGPPARRDICPARAQSGPGYGRGRRFTRTGKTVTMRIGSVCGASGRRYSVSVGIARESYGGATAITDALCGLAVADTGALTQWRVVAKPVCARVRRRRVRAAGPWPRDGPTCRQRCTDALSGGGVLMLIWRACASGWGWRIWMRGRSCSSTGEGWDFQSANPRYVLSWRCLI